ncbi:MAG: prolipoprotein diacylglyceryl transferase, partial [Flavobacteriales bacterium]|nr:prolipoprotein diacylglyceryl transferase [Flavobacteriales bacterium]
WSDVVFNGLIGFVVGWKFIWLLMNAQTLFKPGELPQHHIFSWQGNWALGLLLGLAFGAWRWYDFYKERRPVPEEKTVKFHAHEHTGTITFIAAVGGIAGAKIFAWLEDPDGIKAFFDHFSLEEFLSGLTVYGGLIIGGGAVLFYAWRKRLALLPLVDAAAPGMMLAYGIGRMGCQVSGDGDWGVANTNPKPGWLSWLPDSWWAYDYPNNVQSIGVPMTEGGWEGYGTHLVPPVFPTPIYEIIMAVIIFAVLWYLRKKIAKPGLLFAIYMLLCGFERLCIEQIRVNERMNFAGMSFTQAELISVLFIAGGAAMAWWVTKKRLSPPPQSA